MTVPQLTRLAAFFLIIGLAVGCQRPPAGKADAQAQAAPAAAKGTAPAARPTSGSAGQATGARPAAQTPAQPPAAKPFPTQLPDVLARVNGEPISRSDFETALRNVEARAGQPVPAERRDEVYRGLLDQLVTFRVLLQESKARGVSVTDAEVENRVGQIKKQFPSEDVFKKALAEQKVTMDALKTQARQELTLDRMVQAAVSPQIAVQERDVKDFYDKNPDKFQQPEAVRASHILFRVEPNATEAQKKEARAKAEKVLAEVKAGGDFAALAKQHSQDGSAPAGGDLNFFSRGQMVPAFEKAAYALEPGEVSGIVETQFGYHIIKATEQRPARTVPLAEVAQRIGQFLTQQQQQEKTTAFIAGLRSKSKIEILI